jgi:hypothetical protein
MVLARRARSLRRENAVWAFDERDPSVMEVFTRSFRENGQACCVRSRTRHIATRARFAEKNLLHLSAPHLLMSPSFTRDANSLRCRLFTRPALEKR